MNSTWLHFAEGVPDVVDLSEFDYAPSAVVTRGPHGIDVVTTSSVGEYFLRIPIAPNANRDVLAKVGIVMTHGCCAVAFVTEGLDQIIDSWHRFAANEDGPAQWTVKGFERARWMLIRNDSPAGSSFRLSAITLQPLSMGELPQVAELHDGIGGRVDLAGLATIAEAMAYPENAFPKPANISVDAVPVERLGERLGFATPFNPAMASRKPLTAWRMEDDDQNIFRYLYKEARPRRHLEFGTWLGAGTVYCLEESSATVWTINLWEGEHLVDGLPAYNGSDAGVHIGRHYKEAGLGHRVCQIFSNSRDWDISNYPAGFFDTILIDGGHHQDVVLNDTLKAITLLRTGGLCMWHDFAPDPAVFRVSPSAIGVARGIHAAWPEISSAMRDVFYIWPSQILVAVRNTAMLDVKPR